MSKFDIENLPTSETGKRMLKRVAPIYQNSYVAKWLYQVMGEEWDGARDIALSLRDQIFTETVTWGIEYQEHKYSIVPDESLSLDERRARLKRQTQQKFPLNPGVLEQFIKNGWGITADVDETVDYGRIQLTFPDDLPSTVEEMLKEVRRIKPSHLVLFLKLIRELHLDDDESKIRLGIKSVLYGPRSVGLILPENFIGTINTTVVPAKSGIDKIGVGVYEHPADLLIKVGTQLARNGIVNAEINLEDLPDTFREKDLRLAPTLGINYSKHGFEILPLAIPDNGELDFKYGIRPCAVGWRLYGLAIPEDEIATQTFGAVNATNSLRKISPNLDDMPKWYVGQPLISGTLGIVSGTAGKNLIGLYKPEREKSILATGFLHGAFGLTSLAVEKMDMPPAIAERQSLASIGLGIDVKSKMQRRIFSFSPLETANAIYAVGTAQNIKGVHKIGMITPSRETSSIFANTVNAAISYRIIGADLSDLAVG